MSDAPSQTVVAGKLAVALLLSSLALETRYGRTELASHVGVDAGRKI